MNKDPQNEAAIRARFVALRSTLNEAARRRWLAAEACALGRGGPTRVAAATGVSLPTIRKGLRELGAGLELTPHRARRPGGGRKSLLHKDASLLTELYQLLAPVAAPNLLEFSTLTPRTLSKALRRRNHVVSEQSITNLLRTEGYGWQRVSAALRAGRGEQLLRWRYIMARALQFCRCAQPVLFLDLARGRTQADAEAAPAVRLLPSSFAVRPPELCGAALRCFLRPLGPRRFPDARELLLLIKLSRQPDSTSLWRAEARRLAEELELSVQLIFVPGGIYKWRSLRPRLLCSVSPRGSAKTHLASTITVAEVDTRPAAELPFGRRLYAALHPYGLITDGVIGAAGSLFSVAQVHAAAFAPRA